MSKFYPTFGGNAWNEQQMESYAGAPEPKDDDTKSK